MLDTTGTASRTRYRRETPSGDEDAGIAAGNLFGPRTSEFAEFGKALHAFMSHIEWYRKDLDLDAVYAAAMQELDVPANVARDAFNQLKDALRKPEVQTALTPASDAAATDVWLERRFELLLDDTWVSGCFDRVVIKHAPTGAPTAAMIIDYKTSVVSGPESLDKNRRTYAPQLETYRKALSRMTGIGEDKIRAQLIFTRTGDVVEC